MAERRYSGERVVDGDLVATLETPVPTRLPVGRATAVLCWGTCFHRRSSVERVAIIVDGVPHRATASRMPRADLFRALHPHLAARATRDSESSEDPELRSYRSGFWGIVPIPARRQPGAIELRIGAELAGGEHATALLARIEVHDSGEPVVRGAVASAGGAGLIAVCMATFDPDVGLLRTQIDSLRAQTDRRWMCVISDDCSSRDRFEAIETAVAGDPRFVLSRSSQRLGFYRNFERALRHVPPEAELVALCDQDDRWYPDKLETLRGALGRAELVYSDLRLVDDRGRVLAEGLWESSPRRRPGPASLLLSNTIPGAASLFRRRVIDRALPFPEGPGWQFHDHWLGAVAAAAGEIAYVHRPLYDYVQHRGAVLRGEIGGGSGATSDSAAAGRRRRRALAPRRLLSRWRTAYFHAYLPLALWAHVLLARCSGELTRRKSRALKRLVAADRSPLALLWLAAGGLRAPFTRSEVDAARGLLCGAIVWRHLVTVRAGRGARPGRDSADASPPPFEPHLLESTRRVRRRL